MASSPLTRGSEAGTPGRRPGQSLLLSKRASHLKRLAALVGHALLLLVTSSSALAVLFIFYFIARDALPFFFTDEASVWARLREFFTGRNWYPSAEPASFGAFPIFVGTALVTLGAVAIATPLGVAAAVCLSDVLPFRLRQIVKPVVEMLAAIPSVAYGFFALIVLAPLLQDSGGAVLAGTWWCISVPVSALLVFVLSDIAAGRFSTEARRGVTRLLLAIGMFAIAGAGIFFVGWRLWSLEIESGTNALNVSLILGIMALPTIVSVSEDALQAVGRELREGAYALGATRAEALARVIIPAAGSGICAAIILGVMRAVGETMVVWMASGNAAQIPQPWCNLLQPVRTLTATIAGDMGEADHVTGSSRYHVLFAMALALLLVSFVCNLISERAIARSVAKLKA